MHGLFLRKPRFRRSFQAILAGLMFLGADPARAHTHMQTTLFTTMTEIDLPVAPGAQEPSLFTLDDGRILMSWTEPADKGYAVKTAIGDLSGWSKPVAAVISDRLFVNWADFPSVAAFPDGSMAVNWLMKSGRSPFDYDLNIALSSNEGRTWGDVIVPHRDGTRAEHGFATLLPMAQNRLLTIWLDGRAFDENASGAADEAFANAMQLRATTIGPDGRLSGDILLDARTCTCCQTSAAATGDGGAIVVYRDRTQDEIRDISVVRLVDGVWSDPQTVHPDGWEIDGCPVNGPAIDSHGQGAVVAWFTGAGDVPVVNLVFSDDSGKSFGPAIRVDKGEPAGRVDVLQLGDGSALVSWVEWTAAGEALLVCRVLPSIGCVETQIVTLNNANAIINFPKMVRSGDKVYFAWTQPLNIRAAKRGRDVIIRMIVATL